MLHQDGSRCAWLDGQPPLDLIVTMDDATSTIYSAFLVEEEGTASTFAGAAGGVRRARAAGEPLHRSRQPLLLHAEGRRGGRQGAADPGRAGARPARDRAHPGLFAGGARALGAHVRHAAGPAAEGARSWPASRDVEAANRFIREVYLPAHNARFAKPPAIAESAFVRSPTRPARRDPVHRGGAGRRPRQHRRLCAASGCSCRKAGCAPTTSRRASRCASIRTARSPSSMGRACWRATTPPARPIAAANLEGSPRDPLRRDGPAGGLWTGSPAHKPPTRKQQKRTIDVLPKPDNFKSYRHAKDASRAFRLSRRISASRSRRSRIRRCSRWRIRRRCAAKYPGGHTKNLFLKDKKDNFFLVTVGEEAEVDLKQIHQLIGAVEPRLLRQAGGADGASRRRSGRGHRFRADQRREAAP